FLARRRQHWQCTMARSRVSATICGRRVALAKDHGAPESWDGALLARWAGGASIPATAHGARTFTPFGQGGHKAAMQIHRGYWSLPQAALHGVVAIGNFDGVHRGHRALIEAARARARELEAPLGVITFEPHPREVLTPDRAPPRLTPFRIKARLLAELEVAHLFALAFNQHLMSKSPEQFVHDVLAGGLGVRHVVVGFDFRFGHKRVGDADLLAALGDEYGFGVTRIEPVAWRGEVCSSSRVRDAVARGDVALARDLLGHPFLIEGRVVAGDRRGRELGYPTANLRP